MNVTLKNTYQLTVRQYWQPRLLIAFYLMLSLPLLFSQYFVIGFVCAAFAGIIQGKHIQLLTSFSCFFTAPNTKLFIILSTAWVNFIVAAVPSCMLLIGSGEINTPINLFFVVSLLSILFLYIRLRYGGGLTIALLLLLFSFTFSKADQIHQILQSLPLYALVVSAALSLFFYYLCYRSLAKIEWSPDTSTVNQDSIKSNRSFLNLIRFLFRRINKIVESTTAFYRAAMKWHTKPDKAWKLALLGNSVSLLSRYLIFLLPFTMWVVFGDFFNDDNTDTLMSTTPFLWSALLISLLHEPTNVRGKMAMIWLRSSDSSKYSFIKKTTALLLYRSLCSSLIVLAIVAAGYIYFDFDKNLLNAALVIICAYPGFVFLSFSQATLDKKTADLFSALCAVAFFILPLGILFICLTSKLLLIPVTVVLVILAVISVQKWSQLNFDAE